MKKYSYKNNRERYTEKLIDCIGAAIIAGYHNHADILHGLSCDVMGLTVPPKCAMILSAGEKPEKNETEGNAMIGYFYKTNDYEGIVITNGDKWVSFTDSEKIDGLHCEEKNAQQIGENFKNGIASGEFDTYEFNDWYENTGAGTHHTSGTGAKKFLHGCESYYRIF